MADTATLERITLAAARRRALLPRRALLGVCAVLALLGVKGLLRPAPAPVIEKVAVAAPPARESAAGFAEAFARAYLTWDTARPELHSIALAPYLGPDIDADAGLPVPVDAGDQRVTWTATVDQVDTDPGRLAVTVAVAIDGTPGLRYLAVPVAYDRSGALAVPTTPPQSAPPVSPTSSRDAAATTSPTRTSTRSSSARWATTSATRSRTCAPTSRPTPCCRCPNRP